MITFAALNAVKILAIGSISCFLSFVLTPIVTYFLYKNRCWRKEVRKKAIDGQDVTNFQRLHGEGEIKTPRMGGILIWLPVLAIAFIFLILSKFFPEIAYLNFINRSETWIPLFALFSASLVGLIDDLMQISDKGGYIAGGLSLKYRIGAFALMGLIGGLWCYYKLGWNSVYLPFVGDIPLGWLYIPFFILVMLACYSGGVIDGIDGLAGGSFLSIFGAYGFIAFAQGRIDLAAFCIAIFGALLSYLWFNIPPARFYMGETGSMGLCASLAVVAFFSDAVLVLPIIGFLLVLEAGSVIVQLICKKIWKKKLLLAAPLHLHLEAIGWPPYKVTMRFWVIGVVMAILGVIISLIVF